MMSRSRMRAIITEVAEQNGFTYEEITGLSHVPKYVRVRVIAAMKLASMGVHASEIGRQLNRDHSTVLYYLGRSKGHQLSPLVIRTRREVAENANRCDIAGVLA